MSLRLQSLTLAIASISFASAAQAADLTAQLSQVGGLRKMALLPTSNESPLTHRLVVKTTLPPPLRQPRTRKVAIPTTWR